jgi:hypothetical protein
VAVVSEGNIELDVSNAVRRHSKLTDFNVVSPQHSPDLALDNGLAEYSNELSTVGGTGGDAGWNCEPLGSLRLTDDFGFHRYVFVLGKLGRRVATSDSNRRVRDR